LDNVFIFLFFASFKIEKNSEALLPFALIETVHSNHLDLRIKPFNKGLINLQIEQVYLTSTATDTFLVYLQPNITQAKLIGQALANTKYIQNFNFTVETQQATSLIQFSFNFPADLINIIDSSCRLSIPTKDLNLSLANPSVNSVLARVQPHFTSIYGVDFTCQLFLSRNLWLDRTLFHTVFTESQSQAHLKISPDTGLIRMKKPFYGKLVFQFNARLFFKDSPLRPTTESEIISLKIVSVDERPSLNSSVPIHASMDVLAPLNLPVVTYFRKTSSQNVFDSIHLTVNGDLGEFSLTEVLYALNWNYNEFNSYFMVYCFDTKSLQKFEICPFELHPNGDVRISERSTGTDQVSLLLRLSSSEVPQIKYLNLSVRNSSGRVEFENENCTVLVRLGSGGDSSEGNRLVERFNFEQSQIVPVLLFRMAVKQNETQTRFKYTMTEVDHRPDETNQLNSCFDIDSETGDIFFKCKWPFAHHSLFKPNERVARIEKLLKIKVRKYPANIDTITYLNIQFELTADNNSLSDNQRAYLNILMFNCAKVFATSEANNLKHSYLINKLIANNFKHLLGHLKSRNSIKADSKRASNFRQTEFDIIYETETAPIPAQTDIYRIDFEYLLRQFGLEDSSDEGALYELNQIENNNDTSYFRLNSLTGLVTLSVDLTAMFSINTVYRLHFNATKSFKLATDSGNTRNSFESNKFTANIYFKVKKMDLGHLPRPVMSTQSVSLTLDNSNRDKPIMNTLDAYLIDSNLNVSSVYEVNYRVNSDRGDTTFYVNPKTGKLYARNNIVERNYKFDLITVFKYNGSVVHELTTRIEVQATSRQQKLTETTQMSTSLEKKPNKHTFVAGKSLLKQ